MSGCEARVRTRGPLVRTSWREASVDPARSWGDNTTVGVILTYIRHGIHVLREMKPLLLHLIFSEDPSVLYDVLYFILSPAQEVGLRGLC